MIEKTIIYANEMAAKYETEKKELEIERQKSVIARANMLRWLLVAGITVSIIFLVLMWYMLRLRNRSNRALADMNATKDKFFSIISHDLKNPAISQRDALRSLVRNGRVWDADTLSDYYGELLQSAETEVELIYNLLDWSRIQTNRMTCSPRPFNLELCLRNDISMACSIAEKKGITLHAEIPDDVRINGDANMISTVVRNLLTNAVKFTVAGGTVVMSVEPAAEGKYVFTVSDTGTGMNEEEIRQLFRFDGSHSRKGTEGEQGTGLGLIVCKDLLEKHGTTLQVESEKGVGSRFWFEV